MSQDNSWTIALKQSQFNVKIQTKTRRLKYLFRQKILHNINDITEVYNSCDKTDNSEILQQGWAGAVTFSLDLSFVPIRAQMINKRSPHTRPIFVN